MKRNTIQRTLVLEAVNHLRSHATAEEVYDAIVQQHPHISKGTVYRNLNQLAKDGEIQKLENAGWTRLFRSSPSTALSRQMFPMRTCF